MELMHYNAFLVRAAFLRRAHVNNQMLAPADPDYGSCFFCPCGLWKGGGALHGVRVPNFDVVNFGTEIVLGSYFFSLGQNSCT